MHNKLYYLCFYLIYYLIRNVNLIISYWKKTQTKTPNTSVINYMVSGYGVKRSMGLFYVLVAAFYQRMRSKKILMTSTME